MASYNRVILMGNLCREPDLKRTQSGLFVSELRLAVSEVFRNRTTNDLTERTCFVDVTVWGQPAEACRQRLTKGSPVFIEGRLVYDEWKSPQGEMRSKLRVQADRVRFLDSPRSGAAPTGAPAAAPAAPQPAPAPMPAPVSPVPAEFSGDPSNDDPPF